MARKKTLKQMSESELANAKAEILAEEKRREDLAALADFEKRHKYWRTIFEELDGHRPLIAALAPDHNGGDPAQCAQGSNDRCAKCVLEQIASGSYWREPIDFARDKISFKVSFVEE